MIFAVTEGAFLDSDFHFYAQERLQRNLGVNITQLKAKLRTNRRRKNGGAC
jgi:hypothetical protein